MFDIVPCSSGTCSFYFCSPLTTRSYIVTKLSFDIYKLQGCNLQMADFFEWNGGCIEPDDAEPIRKFLESRREFKKRLKHYLYRTSYHEAGHAVIAALHGAVVNFVDIYESDGSGLTSVKFQIPKVIKSKSDREVVFKKLVENRLELHLAGLVAEEVKFGKPNFASGRIDLRDFYIDVGKLLGSPATGSQVLEARRYFWEACHKRLEENWEWVERLAAKLLDRKCLSHKDVEGCRSLQVRDGRQKVRGKVIYVDFSNNNRIIYDDNIS